MTDGDLARGTRALYDLLVGDTLGQAWGELGFAGEPGLLANDYGKADRAWNPLGKPPERIALPSPRTRELVPISAFLAGTCITWNGVNVSRWDLISFSCLTLPDGGHYSPDFERALRERREPFQALVEIGRSVLVSNDVRRLRDELIRRG